MLTAVPIVSSGASLRASHSGHATLVLKGPRTNKMGASFNYTISGTATRTANYLIAWEQFYPQGGCASTYAGESVRAYFDSTYGLTLFTDRSVSGSYSMREQFSAEHTGKHGLCAYLVSSVTGTTYAWGGAFWNNVK
jgi:hypothetical protein